MTAIPTFVAAGTKSAGTTGATAVNQPTMIAGDIAILVATTIAGGSVSITTTGGWTWNALSGSPIDVTSGEKLYVWWGRYSGSETAPSVTPGGDHVCAGMSAIRGCLASGSPIDVVATGTETTSDTSYSFATGLTTSVNNCLCFSVCSSGYDSNTAQVPVGTNAALSSLTSRMNYETSNGGGGGFGLTTGGLAAAGSMGTFAATLAQSTPKAYIAFALKPDTTLRVEIDSGWPKVGSLVDVATTSLVINLAATTAPLLVCCVNGDDDWNGNMSPATVTGAGLTWTKRIERVASGSWPGHGMVSIWTAPRGTTDLTGTSITITRNEASTSMILLGAVYALNNADPANFGNSAGTEQEALFVVAQALSTTNYSMVIGAWNCHNSSTEYTPATGVTVDQTGTSSAGGTGARCNNGHMSGTGGSVTIGGTNSHDYAMICALELLFGVQTYSYSATGGALVGGSMSCIASRVKTSAGGAVIGGAATITMHSAHAEYVAQGGAIVGGASGVTRKATKASVGGAVIGGAATIATNVTQSYSYTSQGGAVIGGTAPKTFMQELVNSPAGNVVKIQDCYGRPALVKDNHGAGDVLGLFWDGTATRFYLRNFSTNAWIAASNTNAYGPMDSNNGQSSIAQDSAGKIHFVWMQINLTNVAYSRLALTRDGSGHVTNFAWDADNLTGPTLGTGDWRLHLIVGKDGAGSTESLILALAETTGTYGVQYATIAKTLAPANAAAWVKLDGSAGKTTVFADDTSSKYTDINGTLQTINPTNAILHMREYMVAQHPVDRSLHFFSGARFVEPGTGLDMRVWRYAVSGNNFALDNNVNALSLCRNAVNDRPYLGSIATSGDRIWLAYYDPRYGLRVVHSENNYGNSSGVDLAFSYTADDGLGHMTCGLRASSDNRLWLIWDRDYTSPLEAKTAYWNGSAWSVTDPGLADNHKEPVWMWGGVAVGQTNGIIVLCARNPSGKYLPFIVGRVDDPYAAGAQSYSYSTVGGAIAGGAAVFTRQALKASVGGALAGGSATFSKQALKSAVGGAIMGGSSTRTTRAAKTSAGGALLGGAATFLKQAFKTATGGALAGGSASFSKHASSTSVGGALVGGSSPRVRGAAIPAHMASLVGSYATGSGPAGIAFDGQCMWVANSQANTVSRINASTGALVGTYATGVWPRWVVFDGTNVWVTNGSDNTVSKFRASDGQLLGTYSAGISPNQACSDGTNIWVTNGTSNTVTKLRASDGQIVGTYTVGVDPEGVLFDGTNIWVASAYDGTVTKLLASTGAVVGTYLVTAEDDPTSLAFDGTYLWVGCFSSTGLVVRINAATGEIANTYEIGQQAIYLALDVHYLWAVDNYGAGRSTSAITVFDTTTGGIVSTYRTVGGHLPGGPAVFAGGYLWISSFGENQALKLRAVASTPIVNGAVVGGSSPVTWRNVRVAGRPASTAVAQAASNLSGSYTRLALEAATVVIAQPAAKAVSAISRGGAAAAAQATAQAAICQNHNAIQAVVHSVAQAATASTGTATKTAFQAMATAAALPAGHVVTRVTLSASLATDFAIAQPAHGATAMPEIKRSAGQAEADVVAQAASLQLANTVVLQAGIAQATVGAVACWYQTSLVPPTSVSLSSTRTLAAVSSTSTYSVVGSTLHLNQKL